MTSMEDFLADNGFLIQPIRGCSMLPMLEEATDTVRLVPVTRELVAGDLPLYRRPSGSYVLHRILEVKRRHYLIRGDNCAFVEKVPKSWVIAVAEGYSKRGTYIPVTDPAYQAYVRDILTSDGTYARILNAQVHRCGRLATLLSLAFPSYGTMKERYPAVRCVPLLLPFVWLYRWCAAPFSRNGRHIVRTAFRAVFTRRRAEDA